MPDNMYILDPQCSSEVFLHGLGHTEVGISKPTEQLLIPVEEIGVCFKMVKFPKMLTNMIVACSNQWTLYIALFTLAL